jgi:hypothetical protein
MATEPVGPVDRRASTNPAKTALAIDGRRRARFCFVQALGYRAENDPSDDNDVKASERAVSRL